MRIKLFEDFRATGNADVDLIKSIWEVDPYEFYDILITEFNSTPFISFSFLYEVPSETTEFTPCFYVEDGNIKRAPWYDNIDSIMDSGKYLIVIEAWIRDVDDLPSELEINNRIKSYNFPYVLDPIERQDVGEYYLQFNKIR